MTDEPDDTEEVDSMTEEEELALSEPNTMLTKEAAEQVELLSSLMRLNVILEPINDFALGYKRTLLESGWAPEVAEAVAGNVLMHMTGMALSHIGHFTNDDKEDEDRA